MEEESSRRHISVANRHVISDNSDLPRASYTSALSFDSNRCEATTTTQRKTHHYGRRHHSGSQKAHFVELCSGGHGNDAAVNGGAMVRLGNGDGSSLMWMVLFFVGVVGASWKDLTHINIFDLYMCMASGSVARRTNRKGRSSAGISFVLLPTLSRLAAKPPNQSTMSWKKRSRLY